jgi:hypothetical protein
MKYRIHIALGAVAALCSSVALSSITNVENAYETDTSHVSLPANARGQLVIRECTGCKPIVLRVSKETRYLVAPSRESVGLAALRAVVAADKDAKRMLTVFYHLDSGYVTRVVLSQSAGS